MNSDLKNDVYSIPNPLLELLKSNLNGLNAEDKGYTRCNNMVNDGKLTYPQAKKFKHELENDLDGGDYETHTKDKTKNPTKVRQIKVAKNSDDIFNNRAVYEDINRIKQLLK